MQKVDTAPRLQNATSYDVVLLFAAPLMGAAAGGMGWGIRGQYGHEWGAMVPGVLVGFVLVFLLVTFVCSGYDISVRTLSLFGCISPMSRGGLSLPLISMTA